jgi:hypothetical protein
LEQIIDGDLQLKGYFTVHKTTLTIVAYLCYVYGMKRARVSTTVDGELLGSARRLRAWTNDASLFDAALAALVASHRRTEVDAAYRAYDEHPLDEADEWGDLESFRSAAGSS